MKELDLGRQPVARNPTQRRVRLGAYAVALSLHAILLAVLMRSPRVDVGPASGDRPRQEGISVFVNPAPRPTATTGIKPVVKKTPIEKQQTAVSEPPESGQPAGASGTGAQSDVPVRLVAGQGPSLIKKVNPVYPPMMEATGIEGIVVLDAVIHRDGTIGEITVLQSSNAVFERAAVAAVKQWRYTLLPFEAIVTVTVNFTQPR